MLHLKKFELPMKRISAGFYFLVQSYDFLFILPLTITQNIIIISKKSCHFGKTSFHLRKKRVQFNKFTICIWQNRRFFLRFSFFITKKLCNFVSEFQYT